MEQFTNQFTLLKKSISTLPVEEQGKKLTQFVQQFVKFLGTCEIEILQWDADCCLLSLPNNPKLQNHIGGIQACALILAAESAMALLMGGNLPNGKIALSKRVTTDFVKKAKGNVHAKAVFTESQIAEVRTTEKGEMTLKTEVLDDNDEVVAICEAIWVWK